jgi:hypothetical protein
MLVFDTIEPGYPFLRFPDVTVTSASLHLAAVFGVIPGMTLLGERLSPVAIAGVTVVLA